MVPTPATATPSPTAQHHDDVVLSLRGVTKSFGGPPAIRSIDLDVRTGRIHALLGMNGAGKSTLVQIISGSLAATAGEITVGDTRYRLISPRRARAAGVATVFQRRTLVPSLTVAENILLGELPTRAGIVDWSAARRAAEEALGVIGARIDPKASVDQLGAAQQTLVEIAREIRKGARLLLLDEPTAALGAADSATVHEVVRGLAADGVAVIYISHHLEEVMHLADDVTVLRDGCVVLDAPVRSIDLPTLVRAMVGDDVISDRAPRSTEYGPVVLELQDVSVERRIDRLDLTVRAGEIVAVLGPAGAAQEALFPLLAGLRPADAGRIHVAGAALRPGVRNSLESGLRCVSVDRLGLGLVPGLSVSENITAFEQVVARRMLVRWRRLTSRADELRRRFDVVTLADDPPVDRLSGGNQQKVLLAKWLGNESVKACLLEEPTGGVDISAKAEIHRYIEELAAQGTAVLLASSDVDEVVRLADRIVVVRGESVVAECEAAVTTHEELVSIVLGGHA
ncbi:sugar ABC transporter ATP-binding protein [Herbiconiux ginsengi]|uniref:Ribose transport system ATP-binding protein n=1 Tax=Herbiconiux ginsengi TaxID=381665 RepID=A0A1H3MR03_9MICO|nr:sugar ABC transporter ATP-binding protein [Herbiconiux ginsengi]SDY78868.1 ribose transport system ATP-binding protein [Herbiconiux ginsengi]